MAFVHGKTTKVLVDEYDLSAYLTQIGMAGAVQTVDVTTFSNDDVVSIAGLGSGSINCAGVYDGDTGAVDDVLNTALAGSALVVTVSPQGASTIGDRAQLCQSYEATYNVRSAVNDASRVNATFDADAGIRFGVVLHDLSAETGATNSTSVDNGSSSAYGAAANLHVTAFTGTNATIKVTDSTDDAAFADLITFTVATGVTAEHKTVTGTVNRYARVELTGTFTTITFAVSFARNHR